MAAPRPVTYWEYIRVEELLALQSGLAPDERQISNDEVMFITVHQVYELWFKLVLRELAALRDLFRADRVAEQELSDSVRGLARISAVFARCVDHFEVMETLQTRSYLEFRDKLLPASGFQSAQLRQIEILLGLEDSARLPMGPGGYAEALRAPGGGESPALARVRAALADRPTLKEALDEWLWRTPIDGVGPLDLHADLALERFVAAYLAAHARQADASRDLALELGDGAGERERLGRLYAEEKRSLAAFLAPSEAEGDARRRRIRAAMLFITTYRELPLLAWPREVLDGLVAMEQVFLIFRQRHARMVERVIGRRTGTGGSAGVEYLDQTALSYRVFRDLWACRTFQIRRSATPPLENPAFYGFLHG